MTTLVTVTVSQGFPLDLYNVVSVEKFSNGDYRVVYTQPAVFSQVSWRE